LGAGAPRRGPWLSKKRGRKKAARERDPTDFSKGTSESTTSGKTQPKRLHRANAAEAGKLKGLN